MPRSRLRQTDLAHPHRGVYITESSDGSSLERACDAAAVVMAPQHVFSHRTAARLWGIPLPARWRDGEPVDLLAVGSRGRLRRPGIRSWETMSEVDVTTHDLGPLVSPADTWVHLATLPRREVPFEWLVAAGDYLISGTRLPGGRRTPPLATPRQLLRSVTRHGHGRGARPLDRALPLLRSPVDSPKETLLRLGLVDAGLPEPAVQPPIGTAAGTRHPDLGYLRQRVLLEYLGDVHRTDRRRWLEDLTRVQLFEDAGYRVVLVGADDLIPAGMAALAGRVRRALAASFLTDNARMSRFARPGET